MPISPLARRVLDAYGGEDRWRALRRIAVTFSASGWALRAKWCRPFVDARAEIEIWAPRVRIRPLGARGLVGVLDGGSVRLEDEAGPPTSCWSTGGARPESRGRRAGAQCRACRAVDRRLGP